MKLYLSRSFAAIAFTVVLCSFLVGVASAANYLGGGKFPTNNLNRCHIGSYYATQAQYASGSWSASTDLNMYYACTNVQLWTTGMDYGNTGWVGYAYICNTGGQCNTPGAWDGIYRDCTAKLNYYFLKNSTDDKIKWAALHELGHCYSLGHRTDATSVMQQSTPMLGPNPTDVILINSRY